MSQTHGRKRPVTLRQVADAAGVSIATASYVVSGRPRAIHPDTVRRVWGAVQELGYVPLVWARRLKGESCKTIGVIFPHEIASLSSDPFFGAILDGILDCATELRYSVMLFTGLSWHQAGQGYSVYVDGRCDGHVLVAPSTTPELVGQIVAHGVPLVVVGAVAESEGVASFVADNHAAAVRAVELLAGLGHKRIAHLAGNPSSTDSQEREAGYRAAMAAQGLPVRPEWVYRGHFTMPGGMAAFDCWRTLPTHLRPTAVFASSDSMAMGLLEGAKRRGVRVPEELSIIAFDDVLAGQTEPPLTTFRQNLRRMGRSAAEHLIHVVEGLPPERLAIRFDSPLVERASCAPVGTPGSRGLPEQASENER